MDRFQREGMRTVQRDCRALAKRVFIGPQGPRRCFIDDGHRLLLRRVLVRERAARLNAAPTARKYRLYWDVKWNGIVRPPKP